MARKCKKCGVSVGRPHGFGCIVSDPLFLNWGIPKKLHAPRNQTPIGVTETAKAARRAAEACVLDDEIIEYLKSHE
jgi:hypothetical protein